MAVAVAVSRSMMNRYTSIDSIRLQSCEWKWEVWIRCSLQASWTRGEYSPRLCPQMSPQNVRTQKLIKLNRNISPFRSNHRNHLFCSETWTFEPCSTFCLFLRCIFTRMVSYIVYLVHTNDGLAREDAWRRRRRRRRFVFSGNTRIWQLEHACSSPPQLGKVGSFCLSSLECTLAPALLIAPHMFALGLLEFTLEHTKKVYVVSLTFTAEERVSCRLGCSSTNHYAKWFRANIILPATKRWHCFGVPFGTERKCFPLAATLFLGPGFTYLSNRQSEKLSQTCQDFVVVCTKK